MAASPSPPPDGRAGAGALLQAWRTRALLTQEQLAERAGLSVRTVRRLETDPAARPQGSTLRRLIEALNLEPAALDEIVAAARAQPREGEPAEPNRPPSPSPATGEQAVLRQLPAAPPLFTGRSPELTDLERAQDMSSVVVAAIDGMAGVGKTALALHAAHRLSGEYSDGQLFLNLHGYTHGVEPVQPAEALDRLLRALGVPGEQIPAHTDDRAALYRSRLADRKMLIVLDNAVSEAQVRPLLPGTPGSLALVTSRRRLIELDHTLTVSLDVLARPDAVALFARSSGVDAHDAAVGEVVELCGRLPLALRIAAARLESRPSWTVGHLVERLRDRQEPLGELALGERSVTAALDMSYQQLDPELQRAYRLCGPLPESSFDLYAAAALADVTVGRAARLLDDLLDVHLLQELTPGRYAFHDLIRSHATAAAEREEPDRVAAFGRMFTFYCHTASMAMDVLYPYERERRPPPPPSSTPTPDLPGPDEAAAWLDLELPNLLTAARYAAEFCPRNHTVHLSTTLDRHLRTRDRYAEAEVLHQQALTVARRTSDAAGEVDVLTSLGHVNRRQGRTTLAAERYRDALAIARSIGNRRAEVDALLGLGFLVSLQGSHEAAIEHVGQALEIGRRIGHRSGETDALYRLGWLHLAQRTPDAPDPGTRYERAAGFFEQAHALAREIGNSLSELHGLLGQGWVHRVLGRHGTAEDAYAEGLRLAEQLRNDNGVFEALDGMGRLDTAARRAERALTRHGRALELATDLGQPIDQARSHDGLARAHRTLGRREEARRHWQAALDILSELGADITVDEEFSTAEVRARLDECDA